MLNYRNYKRPIQVYLTKPEWEKLEALESLTDADSKAEVMRAALLKLYKLEIGDKYKEVEQ